MAIGSYEDRKVKRLSLRFQALVKVLLSRQQYNMEFSGAQGYEEDNGLWTAYVQM